MNTYTVTTITERMGHPCPAEHYIHREGEFIHDIRVGSLVEAYFLARMLNSLTDEQVNQARVWALEQYQEKQYVA